MLNNDTKSNITIIGAGPAGSCAAWEVLKKNSEVSVTLFEEHSQIGEPRHCSGLIAYQGLRNLNLNMNDLRHKIGYNEVRRAKFIGPTNSSFEIDRGQNSMVVIDRTALDNYLAERSKKLNAEYNLGQRVCRIHFDGSNWKLHISTKNEPTFFKSKLLINAEGAFARLAKSLGFSIPNRNWLFPALQYEVEGVQDLDKDCAELYFGRKYAPGFFGWVIPINDESARIGLAKARWMNGKTRILLSRFIKKHPNLKNRFQKIKITKSYGGLVPVSGPVKKTYGDNYMVIGDAAGQSKATTGGGVNIGSYCGRIAGMMAQKILNDEISAKQGCKAYQNNWKSQFEPDLSLMKLFRRTLSQLPDETWVKLIKIASDTNLGENLRTSSIDLHGLGLIKYSLKPSVFIKGLRIVPQLAVSLLRGLTI